MLADVGIDGGFSSYQGGCLVDKDWCAHNLFLMILIGGSVALGGMIVMAIIGERAERETWITFAGVLSCAGGAFCYFIPHSSARLVGLRRRQRSAVLAEIAR